nr:hypothetical protein [Variovorax paradoxus]
MARFPDNEIISLVSKAPRFDLAESVGPSVRLSELADMAFGEDADFSLDYGTAAGSSALRQEIANEHGVEADDVVVTVGGAHALFLIAFTLCRWRATRWPPSAPPRARCRSASTPATAST